MKATLKIAGVSQRYASLGYTKKLDQIGVWSGELKEVLALNRWSPAVIQRLGSDDLKGWLEAPTRQWSEQGNSMPIGGKALEGILLEKPTPHAVMTNTSLVTVIDTILSLSGFTRGTVGSFYMVKDPWQLPTNIYSVLPWIFSDTYPKQNAIKQDAASTNVGIDVYPGEAHSGFEANGYLFMLYRNGSTGTLCYRTSSNGTTWSGQVDSGKSCGGGHCAIYKNGYLYLFTGGVFYKCAVSGNTITFPGSPTGTPPYSHSIPRPVFDSEGHIWVIGSDTRSVQESVNEGVNWTLRFTATEYIYAIVPKSSNGDLWLLEFDAGNYDLELWQWNEATDTESFVDIIHDGTGALYFINGELDIDGDGNLHAAYRLSDASLKYRRRVAGAWDTQVDVDTSIGGPRAYLQVDGGGAAWIAYAKSTYIYVKKYVDNVLEATASHSYGVTTREVSVSNFLSGSNKVIWAYGGDSAYRYLLSMTLQLNAIELSRGKSSGYFKTDAQSGDGDFEKWGLLAHDADYESGVKYDILKASDDSLLLSDVIAPADLDAKGLSPSITSIKLKGKLTKVSSSYPVVYTIALSERHMKISVDTDGESVWEALAKVKAQIGGEIRANSDWTVDYLNQIGSDKSATVILRTARSSSQQAVEPTIRNITVEENYSGWANCIKVIGAGTYPSRYEAEIKDGDSVNAQAAVEGTNGEHWKIVRDQDVKSNGMAATRAATELVKALANNYIRYSAEFIDTTDAGDIDIGDTITLIDDPPGCATPVNGAYRIVELNRNWDEKGEVTKIVLAGRPHISSYSEHLLKIEEVKRWVV